MDWRIAGIGYAVWAATLLAGCAASDTGSSDPGAAAAPVIAEQSPDRSGPSQWSIPVQALPFSVDTSTFTGAPDAQTWVSPDGSQSYSLKYAEDDDSYVRFTAVLTLFGSPPLDGHPIADSASEINQHYIMRFAEDFPDLRVVNLVLGRMWGGEVSLITTMLPIYVQERDPLVTVEGSGSLYRREGARALCFFFAWLPPDFSMDMRGVWCELALGDQRWMTRQSAIEKFEALDFRLRLSTDS